MVVSAKLLHDRFNIDVHLNEPVIGIKPDEHKVITPDGEYKYTKLIYAAGAKPFIPPIKNLELADNWSNCRTIEDYDKICDDDVITEKEHILILGAGLIGIEVAENLSKIGKKVTVVELSPTILPAWDSKFGNLAETILKDNNITIKTNVTVEELITENNQIKQARLSNGEKILADYLIMGIGGKPNTQMLLDLGAEHIRNGAVKVNDKMETNLPDIYAAGDCASIQNIQTGEHDYFPMGTHANKGGRAAGANAAGGDIKFRGAYRTAIIKVFDYTLARTGLNPRSLKMAGTKFESTFIISGTTPGFYPDPTDLFMEIYYDSKTRVVLGAELFGQKGVDKRVDVISTAILGNLTVDDLPDLDLAYAPPYSPAKDPVIVAGFVSGNKTNNSFSEIGVEDLYRYIQSKSPGDYQLLDVRAPIELEREGKIANAINLELDELRDRINELDPLKPTLVYCQRGLRGYVATMILQNHGFRQLHNLGGGFKAWKAMGFDTESVIVETKQ